MKEKIKILLVEDHQIVRKGLKAFLELEDDMLILAEAEDGLEAVKLCKSLNPMVIVMDIALPKLNGMEATRQIIKVNPHSKILMLSAYADDGYIKKVIDLGVSGYLIKQCAPDFLIQAIREIHKGNKFFSPDLLERFTFLNNKKMNQEGVSQKKTQLLSERESQVLQMIAEGNANKEIAYQLKISIKTVEKHRQNLMQKLSIHDTAGLTRYAISEGVIENSSQKTIL
ncbi:MAG: response regulator transcription factor [Bacteriovoracaceae bacterium]|nr:response regulator transcription factor [Bacteriovoracaceae bacterium]